METLKTVTSYPFEQWIKEEGAEEQKRLAPILNEAMKLIGVRTNRNGTLRKSFSKNEYTQGFSYTLDASRAFELLPPTLRGLFKGLWKASTNFQMNPREIVCHLVSSERISKVISISGINFYASSTMCEYKNGVTIVSIPEDFGNIQGFISETNADINLIPGSVWRVEPHFNEELLAWREFLSRHPESRAKLALEMAKSFTSDEMIALGKIIPVVAFDF